MVRGGSRRGEHSRGGDFGSSQAGGVGADGWAVAGSSSSGLGPGARQQQQPGGKAGDLSNFGKFSSKPTSNLSFGPSGVFAGKKDTAKARGVSGPVAALQGEGPSLSRSGSSQNMFQMLSGAADAAGEVGGAAGPPPATTSSRGSRPPSRKASVDFGQDRPGSGLSGDGSGSIRRKLILQPRSVPSAASVVAESTASTAGNLDEEPEAVESGSSSGSEDEGDVGSVPSERPRIPVDGSAPATRDGTPDVPLAEAKVMSAAEVKAKVEEDLKEFFALRDLEEGVSYFEALSLEHRPRLIEGLVGKALDSKEVDVKLVAELFSRAADADLAPPETFEEGFAPMMEFLDETALDVPAAYHFVAMLLKGAKVGDEVVESLGNKISVEGEPMHHPREKLRQEYAKLH